MVSIKKPRVSLVLLSAAGASAALLLSACGGGTTNAAGTTSSPAPSSSASPATTASSSPTSPAGSSGTAAPKPAPPADNGLCKAADVSLSLGQGDAAAGSYYRPLDIKNTSGKPCTIQGFPGVSYVTGSDGQQVGEAAFRSGEKGEAIKLNPGQSAAADVQFVNVQNYDPAACKPTPVKGLRVYLPQETAAKFVADPGTGCAAKSLPGNGNQLSVKTVHRA